MVLGWWCGCGGKVGDGSRGGGREVVGGHSSRGGGTGGCASCYGDVSGVVASAIVVALLKEDWWVSLCLENIYMFEKQKIVFHLKKLITA